MDNQEVKQKVKSKKIIYTLKALVYTLELLALVLIIYLIGLPFYLPVKYKIESSSGGFPEAKNIETIKESINVFKQSLPIKDYSVSQNRLVIEKIGVNIPIIESASPEYGLSKGAWRVPESSTPDQDGNTVITGHRFKYLPPNNLTFYLLDKLEINDLFTVLYNGKDYYYRVIQTKIVSKTDLSILEDSENSIVTLFTCHPIYSTENRLVVVGELVEVDE